jgi:hypothetical protein
MTRFIETKALGESLSPELREVHEAFTALGKHPGSACRYCR